MNTELEQLKSELRLLTIQLKQNVYMLEDRILNNNGSVLDMIDRLVANIDNLEVLHRD